MPITADNYSSQMFCWRKKEFFLQTAGENAAVEQTIATKTQLTVRPGKTDVTKIFS